MNLPALARLSIGTLHDPVAIVVRFQLHSSNRLEKKPSRYAPKSIHETSVPNAAHAEIIHLLAGHSQSHSEPRANAVARRVRCSSALLHFHMLPGLYEELQSKE